MMGFYSKLVKLSFFYFDVIFMQILMLGVETLFLNTLLQGQSDLEKNRGGMKTSEQESFPPAVKCSFIDNLSGKIPVLWPCPYCLRCGLS